MASARQMPLSASKQPLSLSSKQLGDGSPETPVSSTYRGADTVSSKREIPIVIISSLRASYLHQVLHAIQPSNQNKNTPSWILNTTCHVFAHKNEHTDVGFNWIDTQRVTKNHGCNMHVFEGLGTENHTRLPNNPIRSFYTKHTWYRMMRYLFHTIKLKEVLVLEDDAVLAPDGLLVAAKLFEHKWKSRGIHAIALGGHAGASKINADPNQFMAVRPRYFQAMAYSMDAKLFDYIDKQFTRLQATLQSHTDQNTIEEENYIELADWTMEITERDLVANLTQLEPSLGRMHHIGEHGMGYDGNGLKRRLQPVPWRSWKAVLTHPNRTMDNLYLYPQETTDAYGYLCDVYSLPPVSICPLGTIIKKNRASRLTAALSGASAPKIDFSRMSRFLQETTARTEI